MRTTFITTAFLWLAFLTASAEVAPSDSTARAQIKEIKLSERYVYADAISPSSFDEAIQAATEELRINATTLLTEQDYGKETSAETLGKLASICRYLQYKQMGMFKAFAYVSKNELLGQKEIPMTVPDTVLRQKTKAETDTSTQIAPSAIPTVTSDEAEFALKETVAETVQANSTETDATQANEQFVTETVSAELVQEPVVKPIQEPKSKLRQNTTLPADTLPEKQQRVINDLLALDTYESIMLYLNAMKEDGRLMYGKMSTLRSPEEAYLTIVKNGQLVTVLGKGKRQRINMKTGQEEGIQQYKGYAVIWLKVFE